MYKIRADGNCFFVIMKIDKKCTASVKRSQIYIHHFNIDFISSFM